MTEREDELILEMIVAEERQRVTQQQGIDEPETVDSETPERLVYEQPETEDDDSITFIEERDVTLRSGVFNEPESPDTLADMQHMPLEQSGLLENFLVVADSPNFKVRVEVDDHNILDDEYSFIETNSNEFTKIGAYQRTDGKYVVSVSDYEFRERFDALIRPIDDNILFDVIRVEVERDE